MRGKVSLLPAVPGAHWSLRAAYLFCKGPAPPSMTSASKTTYRSLDIRSSLGKYWVLDALTNLVFAEHVRALIP